MGTSLSVSQVGWDSHRCFSRASARDEDDRVVWRRKVDHRDRAAMRQELQHWPAGTPVILEATFGWGWISDELLAAGLEPHLASSRKVAAWREARGLAKSDRLDADLLSELWSERSRWWEVWLAPPAVRGFRELLRHRMGLVAFQTAIKNRIHAVLHRHGILHEYSDLFGTQGRRFLQLLIGEKDGTLPESGRIVLKGNLQLLDHVRRLIADTTRIFRREVERNEAGQRLKSLPGVGQVLAYTILAEIGDLRRFRDSRRLAAYSLLVPRANDSGLEGPQEEAPNGRHVGWAGRRTLKWAWIEAAHGAVRSGGHFRALFDRVTQGGTRNRNRGYIAAAHELCRIGYVLLKKNVDYRADLPQPSSQRRRRKTRPGTGQPDVAMVAATR